MWLSKATVLGSWLIIFHYVAVFSKTILVLDYGRYAVLCGKSVVLPLSCYLEGGCVHMELTNPFNSN